MMIRRGCWSLGPLALSLLILAGQARAAEPSAATPAAPAATSVSPAPKPGAPERVEYNRDVRPILGNHCFKCHGFDAKERKAELRLDISDEARKAASSGATPIVPAKPDESELVKRVFATDEAVIMPPAETNHHLTDREKNLLRRWIAEGAEYQPHWSFIAPKRQTPPAVANANWPRNTIDRFILAKLEAEGLRPSPEADRSTLLRRLSFDLTGLPPTPAEVDAFLLDNSHEAYDRVVDRLLASPHFGERLAQDWLDAARFADTNGYHIDNGRDMTRWRDWVIRSFNQNRPFDRFTVEQVAGDLLPDATFEQKIASGFNRNHMINFEGGAIPEEYQTAYVVDRVNTTSTVWLGLTVACSQCHDHKYDPLTQKDFYRLYAFFNNLPENGLDGRTGNSPPLVKAPNAEQSGKLDELTAKVASLEKEIAGDLPEVDAAQAAWEAEQVAAPVVPWSALSPESVTSAGGATLQKQEDGAILVTGANPATETYTFIAEASAPITAIRLEALADDSLPVKGPGRSHNGNFVLTDVKLATTAGTADSKPQAVKLASAWADFSQEQFPIDQAIDKRKETGWAILPEVGKSHIAVFRSEQPLAAEAGRRVVITLDFHSKFAEHQIGRFRLSVTDAAQPIEPGVLPPDVRKLLAIASADRSAAERAELRKFYREQISPQIKLKNTQLLGLKNDRMEFEKSIPTAMVMQEMESPRETFMLVRGQYDQRGEKVSAGVPGSLPQLPEGAPANRLGLARWLVDPGNPLVARVAVNRYWQMFFGMGLVKTSEDFGSQGELPSHPELLDWLATEFVAPTPTSNGSGASGTWDVKALCRQIVTSAAYRQASHARPELRSRDPENRWLARAPRPRLHAEFIRDQALAVSGLLNDQIGGSSVSPYQPPGLWEELSYRDDGKNWTAQSYTQSHGPDLYRRTMYTFWKRTSPPPTLITFDAPDRETCLVRRSTTNTPLQALVLLNDPTYIEAARKLAERIMTEAPADVDERIALAFRLATARRPNERETAVLRRAYEQQLAAYRANPAAAEKLLAVGESPRNEKLDAADLAAWATVANMILNLDETVSKG
ncbi:MAG TPA: PSD1 and planctomycete cytochrome C domain-containing protein [Pirellulales bacterium]